MVQCHSVADRVRKIELHFEKMGGVVLLGAGRENLCRRANPRERSELPGAQWVIESEGLPNLIHELVHALYLGHLDDDHGFDYAQIPLDLSRVQHRRWVWEELASCALSVTTCAPFEDQPEAFARAWFAEQFEIQGVFHGREHDLDDFRAYMDAQLRRPEHLAELRDTLGWGRRALEAVLCEPGESLPECDFSALWASYMEDCAAKLPQGETPPTLRGSQASP